jgi:hypothetical protein
MYRAATVRNQDPWYAAFDVKPGDKLYLAPEQRADDADDDVEEDALGGIALHDDAGEPTNDAADNQPNDKVHSNTPGGGKSVCTRIAVNGSASLRRQCANHAVYVF